ESFRIGFECIETGYRAEIVRLALIIVPPCRSGWVHPHPAYRIDVRPSVRRNLSHRYVLAHVVRSLMLTPATAAYRSIGHGSSPSHLIRSACSMSPSPLKTDQGAQYYREPVGTMKRSEKDGNRRDQLATGAVQATMLAANAASFFQRNPQGLTGSVQTNREIV